VTVSEYFTTDPIDAEKILSDMHSDECGGTATFYGTVRRQNRNKSVDAIEYEHHEALATKRMEKVRAEVIDTFDIKDCRLQHRIGYVPLGEAAVFIACQAKHRGPAFEAVQHAIDAVKARVPLWKKEYYADGSYEYLHETPLQ
jgi:molybdopterin synthase catalytic subunit